MSGQVSRGSAGEYQADERAGVVVVWDSGTEGVMRLSPWGTAAPHVRCHGPVLWSSPSDRECRSSTPECQAVSPLLQDCANLTCHVRFANRSQASVLRLLGAICMHH